MAIVSDVEIRLRADIARLQSDMTSARRTVESATSSMSKAVDQVKSAFVGLAAAFSIKEIAAQLVSAQREFDKLNASLVTATGSTENAGQAFKALQKFAASTPYDLAQATKAFVQLRNLGLTPSEKALRSYGNTASALGKDLSQMVEAVADAATGEFERLKEFGIKAKQNGDTVALTFQGTTTTVKNNAAEIEKYLIGIGEVQFAGGMERQAATLDGAISNLGDTWQATLRAFNESGFGDAAKAAVTVLAETLTNLQAIIKAVAGESKNAKTDMDSLKPVIEGLNVVMESLAIGATTVAFAFKAVGGNIGAVAAAIANPSRAIEILKARFSDLGQEWEDLNTKVAGIVGAAARAREKQAAEDEKNTGDQLARFKIVAEGKAAQTAAEKKAADEAAAFYKKVKDASIDQLAQLEAERDGNAELSSEEKKRIEILNDLAGVGKVLSEQQKQDIRGWASATVEVAKYNKNLAETRKLQEQRDAEAYSDVAAAKAQTQALQDQITYYGLTEEAVLKLKAAEIDRALQNGFIDETERKRLQGLLDATNDQITLQKQLTKMKAATQFWTSLEDAAHQTFLSIQNGNKDLWARLRDTAKNIFFEWLYQQTVKKWIINIGTSFDGTSAVSGIANALGGSGSSSGILGAFSSGSNLLSIGKMIYSGFSSGIASSLGNVITSLGNTFGSAAVSSFGTGMGLTTAQASTAAAAYGGTSTAVGGGLTAGASAASAIPIIGWIIAGMQAANGFAKQGFTPNNGTISNPLAQAFTSPTNMTYKALEKLGVGSSLANILSGAAINTKLFGRADPRVESQGVRGTISAAGVDADSYANIIEKGGLFRSSKRYQKTADLAAETDKAWDDQITSMIATVKGFGSALGIQTDAINAYTKSFDIKLTGDETKDNEAIAALFASVSDELSTALVPSIQSFQVEGESLGATLQRLVGDYATVNAAFEAIGKTISVTGEAGIKAREGLIAAAGGLDTLVSGLSYFQQNFLTQAEQLAPVQKQVAEFLSSIGQAGLSTVEQYKQFALGIDVTTEAGQKLFAEVIAMAPAFKEVADAAKSAADAAQELADAQAKAQAAAIKEQAKEHAAMLKSAVGDALDVIQLSVKAQKDANQAAFDQLMAGIETGIESTGAAVTRLQSLADALKGGVATRGANYDSARAALAAAAQVARTSGVLPSVEDIKDALAAVRADNSQQFSSLLDYQRAAAAANLDIADLAGAADTQLSVAQETLLSLQEQKVAAQAAFAVENARLDSMVTYAQAQLDKLNGINTGVLALPEALANFAATIAAAMANPIASQGAATQAAYSQYLGRAATPAEVAYWQEQAAAGRDITQSVSASDEARIQALYQKYLGRTGEAAGVDFYEQALANGKSWSQIEAGFAGSAEAQNRTSDLAGVVSALQDTMANMQTAMNRTANATQQLAQQFDAVSASGNALLTESA